MIHALEYDSSLLLLNVLKQFSLFSTWRVDRHEVVMTSQIFECTSHFWVEK